METEEKKLCKRCQKDDSQANLKMYLDEDDKTTVYYCDECATAIQNEYLDETRDINVLGALGMGLLSSLALGFIWYWVCVLTNTLFDIVVIGFGFGIAIAISYGAGWKKGIKIQLLSAVFSILAMIFSTGFIALHDIANASNMNLLTFLSKESAIGLIFDFIFMPIYALKITGFMGFIFFLVGTWVAFVFPQKSTLKLAPQSK